MVIVLRNIILLPVSDMITLIPMQTIKIIRTDCTAPRSPPIKELTFPITGTSFTKLIALAINVTTRQIRANNIANTKILKVVVSTGRTR